MPAPKRPHVADIDIWRSAKLMIDQHGEDAATEAALRADALLDQGAITGAATWRRVMKAIEQLQAPRLAGPTESVH